jgi:hypothetical protein
MRLREVKNDRIQPVARINRASKLKESGRERRKCRKVEKKKRNLMESCDLCPRLPTPFIAITLCAVYFTNQGFEEHFSKGDVRLSFKGLAKVGCLGDRA